MGRKNSLTIIQLNDSHAYFDLHEEIFWDANRFVYRPAGGYARIAAVVKQVRAENPGRVLFGDCGDTLHGTYPAVQTRGGALVPVLNALGLDAMTAHWEFAYGPKTFRERASQLNYPMLAVNVFEKETKARVFPPYGLKEIGGLRIGLVGIACNIVDKTMPPSFSEGVCFTLGKDELPAIIDELRAREKVDLIVLISHLGFPQDLKLLSEVPGVDVCLSGHTHNRLYKPVRQGQTLVIQSGSQGSFLGILDLTISAGKVLDFQHRLLEISADTNSDSETEDLIRQALAPFKDGLSEVVGETATPLNRGTVLEATMDNFLLAALIESTGAEIAFSNGWRYGAPIPAGKILLNDLYNMVPMDPPVSTVDLTGTEILEMLEENLERTFSPDPYGQMGGYLKRCLGIKVYFKIENPPGRRIQKVFVGPDEISSERTYSAAFVTHQGVPQRYGRHRENRSEHIVEAMRKYLQKHHPLRAELTGSFVAV